MKAKDKSSTAYAEDIKLVSTIAQQYWESAGVPSGAFVNTSISIADLADNVAGITEGNQILLSATAAGWGWFADSTPASQEEFLPTSASNDFQARAGGLADGRLDLLTVVIHEFGHVLGLGDTPDNAKVMAQYLTPGVRRLPSDADIAALQAKLASIGDGVTEFADNEDRTSLVIVVPPATTTAQGNTTGGLRYQTIINPALTNSNFSTGSGWATAGNVAFNNGAATLTETVTTQTRLNQVFIVGENDRFLSFTVADTALDDADQAPDDAFEVALLDANTGASLLGGTGLTRNDAFLNLQADGTERKSQAVTSIRNADGSRTYLVDLAGIPAGTAVNLAFDLIGFGKGAAAVSSHLTIRDLRIGVPQTKDDSITLAEDTPTTIAALANDLNARQPGFAPVIVEGPTHGQVTINLDGTFNFAPDKDWHGEDRFSYKLSDGHVDSNLAIVSLTVTPVNDAPVATDDAASVAEDGTTTASGSLLANDSDVDGDALGIDEPGTYTGIYGTLTLSQDGSYSYALASDSSIVQALRAGEIVSDVFAYAASDGLTTTPATLTVTITGTNDAPVTADDTASVAEDGTTTATGNLLTNDSDVDTGAVLNVATPGDYVGAYGTLTLSQDGSYSYALANESAIVQALRAGEIVSDVFAYAATDGISSTPATVTVTITGTNDGPVTVERHSECRRRRHACRQRQPAGQRQRC
ncbi:MAG: tandem-95 repeat protein [Burkholderiales bacterium]|nr:tandem-95 repeat protein [Burkholderiales bacterium]